MSTWRSCVIRILGIWSIGLLLPRHGSGQTPNTPFPSRTSFALSIREYGYVCADSNARVSPAHALRYRNSADTTNTVVVSVSRLSADSASTTSVPMTHVFLQTRADQYLDAIGLNVTRGVYDAYKLADRQLADTTIQALAIPGYVLSVAVRRQQSVAVRFAYWYVVGGWLIQIRAAMPPSEVQTSTLPLFVNTIVGQVAQQSSIIQPRH